MSKDPSAESSQIRLENHLRELFALDTADLDFGIYRLFGLRRAEIETFLRTSLPAKINEAFATASGLAPGELARFGKLVEDRADKAREALGPDAIGPDGEPDSARINTQELKDYAQARKLLAAVETSEAQRADVFNLLYAFFSRYYDEGDFVSRRFYGARPAYAIPYNGQETLFHWANADQYYVKTGETFRDYAFTLAGPEGAGDYRVRFALRASEPGSGHTGAERFFFPQVDEAVFDAATLTYTIPFELRSASAQEAARFGERSRAQAAISEAAVVDLLASCDDEFLRSALAAPSPTPGGQRKTKTAPSLLFERLSHFTRRNTSDYFIHKDLENFFRGELEFFIRDQIVHEADLEGDFELKRRTIHVFRELASTLIAFLAQVEEAQKRLFEKRKFVVTADYLLPIALVPDQLWPQVLDNGAQLAEWRALAARAQENSSTSGSQAGVSGSFADLAAALAARDARLFTEYGALVLDTRHFDADFSAALLSAFDDLDEQLDGLLIKSENFQALNLLAARYGGQVDCVYIDPPYNTGADNFAYKDRYQHSSWIAMLSDRLSVARELLGPKGSLFSSINDNESATLERLLRDIFGEANYQTRLSVKVRHEDRILRRDIAYQEVLEDVHFAAKSPEFVPGRRAPRSADPLAEYLYDISPTEAPKRTITLDRFTIEIYPEGSYTLSKEPVGRADLLKRYTIRGSLITQSGSASEFYEKFLRLRRELDGAGALYKVIGMGTGGDGLGYRYVMQPSGAGDNGIYFQGLPIKASDPSLPYPTYIDLEAAFNQCSDEGGVAFRDGKKPLKLFEYLYGLNGSLDARSLYLDFFAGSGSAGHAVIAANRADGGRRKFILVEAADYFDTTLVTRIKNVMFSPVWHDGAPRRLSTAEELERGPRLVKVLRLESYEDALHNTFSEESLARLAKREQATKDALGPEEYLVHYLVRLPTEASSSLLDLGRLEHPFAYTIETLGDDGARTQTIDLPETFNLLYGLRVRRILSWRNSADKTSAEPSGRTYRAVVANDRSEQRRILVVWRDMTDLSPREDRGFLEAKASALGAFEERLINGDSAAAGFASLDGLFKKLMEAGG